jgi:hypothetical protein
MSLRHFGQVGRVEAFMALNEATLFGTMFANLFHSTRL